MSDPRYWTESEIADWFDTHPNMTLEQLSNLTGRSIAELKEILMG